MRRVVAGAIAVALWAVPSAAENWRDGCPVGRIPGYKRTDARRIGAVPSQESGLLPLGVGLVSSGAFLTSNEQRARETLLSGRFVARTGEALPGGLIATLTLPGILRAPSSDMTGERVPLRLGLGNVSLALGGRKMWNTQLEGDLRRRPEDRMAGIRGGLAIQGFVAGRRWRSEDLLSDSTRRFVFDRQDFAEHLAGPIAAFGVRGEYRLEAVGCRAPFVHVMAAPHAERGPYAPERAGWKGMLVVPLSAAVGLEIATKTSAYFEYALAVRGQRRDSDSGIWRFSTDHRLRIGVEWAAERSARVGASLDYYAGSLDGLFLNLTLAHLGGYP